MKKYSGFIKIFGGIFATAVSLFMMVDGIGDLNKSKALPCEDCTDDAEEAEEE